MIHNYGDGDGDAECFDADAMHWIGNGLDCKRVRALSTYSRSRDDDSILYSPHNLTLG